MNSWHGSWSSSPNVRSAITTKDWCTRKAVELAPNDGPIVNTLALAEYRSGHWTQSIAANERSMALQNGGDAINWFLVVLAHWQKGHKDEARRWFDKAVASTKQSPRRHQSAQLWKETAELLGQPGPGPSGAGSARLPR